MGWTRFVNMVKAELDKLNKPAQPQQPSTSNIYRVIVNGTQIGAYGNVDNIANAVKEQVKKGVAKIEVIKK